MIKKYNEFINETRSDVFTTSFLEGKIEYNEWEQYFDTLNESKLGDFFQTKIFPVLKSAVNFVKSAPKKVLMIIKKILGAIVKFAKSHPVLFKATIMIVVLLIVTTSMVYAGDDGGEKDLTVWENYMNAAIGILEHMEMDINDTNKTIIDAQTYLIDYRDGVLDNPGIISEQGKELANQAIDKIQELVKEGGERHARVLDYYKELGENLKEIIQRHFNGSNTYSSLVDVDPKDIMSKHGFEL